MPNYLRVLIALCLFCVALFAEDISGKWIFEVQTDAGGGTPTFVFKQAGEKLTGTYTGTFGTAELTGTVKGSAVEFSFEATVLDQKGKVTYTGKSEAPNKMKGDVEFSGLGKGTWTGTKQERGPPGPLFLLRVPLYQLDPDVVGRLDKRRLHRAAEAAVRPFEHSHAILPQPRQRVFEIVATEREVI